MKSAEEWGKYSVPVTDERPERGPAFTRAQVSIGFIRAIQADALEAAAEIIDEGVEIARSAAEGASMPEFEWALGAEAAMKERARKIRKLKATQE